MPYPEWEQVLLDDEVAVQSALTHFYPDAGIDLCLFHINKSILRKMVSLKLIHFFRNCHNEAEVYVYKSLKELFALSFLPDKEIQNTFNHIKIRTQGFVSQNCNQFQIDKFEQFFSYVERNYFGNMRRIRIIGKFDETLRTTNLIESMHSTFKKSLILGRHNSLVRVVSGTTIYLGTAS